MFLVMVETQHCGLEWRQPTTQADREQEVLSALCNTIGASKERLTHGSQQEDDSTGFCSYTPAVNKPIEISQVMVTDKAQITM